jgi:hypothetical protein
MALSTACPELVEEADMRALEAPSGYDPLLTLAGLKFRSAASPDLMLSNPLCCRSG